MNRKSHVANHHPGVSNHWKIRLLILPIVGTLGFAAVAEDKPLQCANLIYGGRHSSRCFSDEFLSAAQRETTVSTERRFRSVKLDSDELFNYPFVLITGEEEFLLSQKERENLKRYCENGGFLLASAGCSSKAFDRAFRREVKAVFGDDALKELPMDHPIFHTVSEIKELQLHHPDANAKLLGMENNGKVVLVYSPHGLNDTEHSEGCCCCGGNEISNSMEINVNILVYALCH
jgi:hypothetical protein